MSQPLEFATRREWVASAGRVAMVLQGQPSILITDDDRDFRETLSGVLEPRGFRTLLADNGQQALDIVQTEPVHLLLIDMHMPRLTGLETLRLVKEIKAMLPCILLSGMLDDAIRHEAEQAQVFSVLAKPVSRIEITTQVELAMSRTYGWG